MVVVTAPRIELRATNRAARITMHVLENRQDRTAGAAEYSLLVPFIFRPDCYRMIGKCLVAILAGIVQAATFHLDGDDVGRSVIVFTTGLRVEIYTTHARRSQRHRFSLTRCREFTRSSTILRRSHRSRVTGPQSGSPISSAAFDRKRPASACGCDFWGGHKE